MTVEELRQQIADAAERRAAPDSRYVRSRGRAARVEERRAADRPGLALTGVRGGRISLAERGLGALLEPDSGPTVEPDNDDEQELSLEFRGYASVTGVGYLMWDWAGPYTEVVDPGAFAATLAAEPDVPLVLEHESLRRMARTTNGTLTLTEDDRGLLAVARLSPTDPDVAYVAPKIAAGLIDEMSFRFYIDAGMWSPDYTQYNVAAVDIDRGDVAIVSYGANPNTAGISLSARALRAAERSGVLDLSSPVPAVQAEPEPISFEPTPRRSLARLDVATYRR